jgi:hypothetical protein
VSRQTWFCGLLIQLVFRDVWHKECGHITVQLVDRSGDTSTCFNCLRTRKSLSWTCRWIRKFADGRTEQLVRCSFVLHGTESFLRSYQPPTYSGSLQWWTVWAALWMQCCTFKIWLKIWPPTPRSFAFSLPFKFYVHKRVCISYCHACDRSYPTHISEFIIISLVKVRIGQLSIL